MQTLTRNWHWARASVGPYTIIASHITAPAYGYETQIVCMLAMDSRSAPRTTPRLPLKRTASRLTATPIAMPVRVMSCR
jgi:hypothetical protein